MATPPTELSGAQERARKTETTSWSAREAAAERPPCVHMRVPSSAASIRLYHDHRGHMRATAVPPVATCDAGARDRPITRQAATIQQRGLTGSARRRWNRTDSQRRVRCHHSSQAPPHLSARRETTDIVPVRVGREGDAFDSPRGKARQGERAHACSMAA